MDIAQNYLHSLATNSSFWSILETAFGDDFDQQAAKSLRRQWKDEKFANLPQFKIVATEEINGANGAYAGETNTVYLAREFLNSHAHNLDVVVNVILEEIGHGVDKLLNKVDTTGDEGELFSALVRGVNLSEGELQRIKTEDDSAIVTIDGNTLEIKQANNLPALATTYCYIDPDDWVYVGQGKFKPYLADIKYLDAFVSNNILRVQVGLDPQNWAFRLNPSLSIFIDSDRNPLTGAINWGTVRGAEYRVDIPILWEPDISSTATLYRLASNYGTKDQQIAKGSASNTLVPFGSQSLELVTLDIPIAALGNSTNVDLYALASLPVMGSINPLQRPDLPYHQGDRAPDYGVYNTSTRNVVVRRSTPIKPAVLIDPIDAQVGPDITKVSLRPIEYRWCWE